MHLQNYLQYGRSPPRQAWTGLVLIIPDLLEGLLHSRFIFAGLGGSGYAVVQLQGWEYPGAPPTGGASGVCQRGLISLGALALPVYEIYKVRFSPALEAPAWTCWAVSPFPGNPYPHWNDRRQRRRGRGHRLFIGKSRLRTLARRSSRGHEHPRHRRAHLIQPVQLDLQVIGRDGAHLLRRGMLFRPRRDPSKSAR